MSVPFEVFRFGFAALFLGTHAVILFGIFLEHMRGGRLWRDARLVTEEELPFVSVVVPARNEAGRIGALLDSLLDQDYSALEFIFVDDRSEDETADLIRTFAKNLPEEKTRLVTLSENPGPNFKQYALSRGIEAARGDFLLFTDADCVVPPGWVRAMARRLALEGTGLVVAPVFKRIERKGFFALYQALDHAIRFVYMAGPAGIGAASAGYGNNLIVKRATLDTIGGYESVPYSVTEDAALIGRVRSHSAYRVGAALVKDARVTTQSEKSWRAFVSQGLRWNNGGLFAPDAQTRFSYNALMLMICASFLVVPLLPFFPTLWPLTASVYLVVVAETLVSIAIGGELLPPPYLRYILGILFVPPFFTLVTLFGYAGVKVRWKNENLR